MVNFVVCQHGTLWTTVYFSFGYSRLKIMAYTGCVFKISDHGLVILCFGDFIFSL
jgi:hypothetical protein